MKHLLIKRIFTELYFIPSIGLDDEDQKYKLKKNEKETLFSKSLSSHGVRKETSDYKVRVIRGRCIRKSLFSKVTTEKTPQGSEGVSHRISGQRE